MRTPLSTLLLRFLPLKSQPRMSTATAVVWGERGRAFVAAAQQASPATPHRQPTTASAVPTYRLGHVAATRLQAEGGARVCGTRQGSRVGKAWGEL